MTQPHLVIGNRNYSSWSMRPWFAMRVAGIEFTDEVIPLDQPETKQKIAAHSGAGRVPVLHHGEITVWESLAILEYLAETWPDAQLWPAAAGARAMARAAASEMHAGFQALRKHCPMNMRRARAPIVLPPGVTADVRRIEELWRTCRDAYGGKGPFLFGRFTNADAMFAPVVNRFEVYAIEVSESSRAYMEAVMALPAWQTWMSDAQAEPWVIAADEA
ncbi:MAG TPA: glutathione S-transferase family protein [Aestuariivirgaceae bacterium]|nr:glutathione S-transferase family protein [Aestuariivirgaceae bacterium]